jgi:hypothetical protein
MKKFYIIFIFCALFFVAGCTNKNTGYLYQTNLYSFKLPADYFDDNGFIKPKQDKAFSTIFCDRSPEEAKMSGQQLLDRAKETLISLCSQTESCGQLIDNQSFNLSGYEGLKYTVQYKGRGADDPRGYINEFHITINTDKGLLHCTASASDLDNPEKAGKTFDEIMGTLTIK